MQANSSSRVPASLIEFYFKDRFVLIKINEKFGVFSVANESEEWGENNCSMTHNLFELYPTARHNKRARMKKGN